MYNNRPQGSSFRGRSKFNNSFRGPSRNGSFGRPRFNRGQRSFGQGGRRRSQLGGDLSIFIKKANLAEDVVYTPKTIFVNLPINQKLKDNILKKGYTTPTPVQDQAIEAILQGRDLIGLANTGTGKTAAFLIPIINKLFLDKSQRAIIIAPTRELAFQINEELKTLTTGMQIYSTVVIGGANIHRQITDLRYNPQVVIGTPGRLKDLIERRALSLFNFSTFVLDEVDLMVDIGFIQDIKYFISMLPKIRQSLFFSATISGKIQEILQAFVNNPVTVSVKKQDTAENIEQNIIKVIDRQKKIEQLHDLLIQQEFKKVLVFGATKRGVEKLNMELTQRGFKVGSIHGNKNQHQRQKALLNFRQNITQVLLATDVAARGLDIDHVTHVINYDLPENYQDYIHRIGRTGRAGQKGSALTFID